MRARLTVQWTFVIALASLSISLLSGCATRYVKTTEPTEDSPGYKQLVETQIDAEVWGNGPGCLIILPTEAQDSKDKTMLDQFQQALLGRVSAAGYSVVPMKTVDLWHAKAGHSSSSITQDLGCDFTLQPRLTRLESTFAGFYSEVRAGGSVEIYRAGRKAPLLKTTHAVSYKDGGLPLGALGALGGAVSAGENSTEAQVTRALEDLARKLASRIPEYAGSIHPSIQYTRFISRYRGDIDTWLNTIPTQDRPLALSQLAAHDPLSYEEREQAYTRLLSLDAAPAHRRELIRLRLGHGRHDSALSAAQSLVRADPADAENWRLLAQSHASLGAWLAADDAIVEALKRAPSHVGLYEELGYAAIKQGKIDRAVAAFQKAVSINPKAAYSLYNLGVEAYNRADFEYAAERFSAAAVAYADAGKIDKAQMALDEIRSIQKSHPSGHLTTLVSQTEKAIPHRSKE